MYGLFSIYKHVSVYVSSYSVLEITFESHNVGFSPWQQIQSLFMVMWVSIRMSILLRHYHECYQFRLLFQDDRSKTLCGMRKSFISLNLSVEFKKSFANGNHIKSYRMDIWFFDILPAYFYKCHWDLDYFFTIFKNAL